MKRLVIALSVAVLIFGITFNANATPVDFLIGDENSISTPSTLTIDADLTQLPGTKFSLDVGQSYTFDYAVIESISTTDNATSYDIVAYLDFDLPDGAGIVGNGGDVIKIRSHHGHHRDTQTFEINFDPVAVEYGIGGLFTVELSDVVVPCDDGYGGGCYIEPTDCTIVAKVTLDAAPVPEPSTLLLLSSGFFGVATFRMRRRRDQN